ncbi:hypothetical protein NDU88_001092 [Pleurodeles waltl]|uniref:Uncharacterized protein n=1 Tax=Pleurodeles waltl TaxID=8319 RepID=A0AAV7WHE8_PLEWA|nr:hypothetical protein NDU88_001092 [Pleurodeles waltl]
MGFPVNATLRGTVLPQFKKLPGVALPIDHFAMNVLLNEWKDPNCIASSSFVGKLYPLEEIEDKLSENVHLDSFVASLVSTLSMAEENILKDVVDKNINSSVKKAYADAHLALCAGLPGTYVEQSSITDFKNLHNTMQVGGL